MEKNGLPLSQGIIALPDPTNSNKYYLLYPKIRFDKAKKEPYASSLNYAVIDMNDDMNNGSVIIKDVPVINDTLNYEGLTACKHGNGRDWWIVVPSWNSKIYQRILLSPKGFQVLKPIEVSDTLINALTQTAFSPDGSKLIRNADESFTTAADIDIFDFDRCSGLMYNQKRIKNTTNNEDIRFGLALSPNGKYMYICHTSKILQFDITAKDISKSADTIAYYDGYIEDDIKVLKASFYLAQSAPDGKIYINSGNGVKHLHVIHKPNKKGVACQMQQHAFRLKTWNGGTLPNYPNYRLGPIDGSPCDTLGIDNIPVALFRYDKDTLNTFLVEFTDLSHHEPAKWEWDFGDGSPKSATQEPVHTYKSKGEYQVCLTVSNANGKHTACKKIGVGVTVGTEEVTNGNISIYPNPAEDFFHIHSEQGAFSISITDIQGRIIYTGTAQNDTTIDTNTWQSGIYQVLITDKISGQKSIEKLIIIK